MASPNPLLHGDDELFVYAVVKLSTYVDETLFYKKLTDGRTFSKLLLCIYAGENFGFLVQDNVCTLFMIQPACSTHTTEGQYGSYLTLMCG